MTAPVEQVSKRCAVCYEEKEGLVFNVIWKIGPEDGLATAMLGFEDNGKPVGVCTDCLPGVQRNE